MDTFFSATTGGFYLNGLHDEMPEDVVEITPERHASLFEGQAAGRRIVAGDDGFPKLGDEPAPGVEEVTVLARRRRDRLLAASDYRAMPDYPQSEAQRAAWLGYRQQLRDLPATSGFPAVILWPAEPTGN
ncbi:tail fiber assembly protein [Lysobacter sp. LF1]|uniref:Tail fiber assembly protein n=1 Tax=Lysobacter stagni TaxID=3045172 RepID=A0ABT6XKX0_9GAMM|nr:tail fiber assembly protein [Lysobacter sp. LF1]MDI9240724.1 tail fiber assembly protein [Lysobacter sp. LF1]